MQEAAKGPDTAMAAVLRLSAEQVQVICDGLEGIYPVNYNCPGQVSVAGLSEGMAEFYAQVKAAGGRAVPLKVSGAFHSPFMEEAAEAFAGELAKETLKKGRIPLYSNMTGERYGESLRSFWLGPDLQSGSVGRGDPKYDCRRNRHLCRDWSRQNSDQYDKKD